MKHYLVTIETAYSIDDYIIPINDHETIENGTEKALFNIGFCDAYEIIKCKEVDRDYMNMLKNARQSYFKLTQRTVEEDFLSGIYTTYEKIMREIKEINEDEENHKRFNNLNKQKFLQSELGSSLIECLTAWDKWLKIGDRKAALWCQAQWEVFKMAVKQFYGIEYCFSRTNEYFGACTEDESDWLFKVERNL